MKKTKQLLYVLSSSFALTTILVSSSCFNKKVSEKELDNIKVPIDENKLKQIEKLEKEVYSIRLKIEQCLADAIKLSNEYNELEANNTKLSKELNEVKTELDKAKANFQKLDKEKKELEVKIENAKATSTESLRDRYDILINLLKSETKINETNIKSVNSYKLISDNVSTIYKDANSKVLNQITQSEKDLKDINEKIKAFQTPSQEDIDKIKEYFQKNIEELHDKTTKSADAALNKLEGSEEELATNIDKILKGMSALESTEVLVKNFSNIQESLLTFNQNSYELIQKFNNGTLINQFLYNILTINLNKTLSNPVNTLASEQWKTFKDNVNNSIKALKEEKPDSDLNISESLIAELKTYPNFKD